MKINADEQAASGALMMKDEKDGTVNNSVAAAQSAAPDRQELAGHLMALPDSQWALWRWMAVRGAGFPIAQILKLSSPDSSAAADDLINAEDELEKARNEALETLRADTNVDSKKTRARLMKAIKKGRLQELQQADFVANREMTALFAAHDYLKSAQSQFTQTFDAESARLSEVIQDVSGANLFREAIIWQNYNAIRGSVDALLRMTPGAEIRRAERRKREGLVVSYLQRYSTKNDTIGFFGPVGWASLVQSGDALTASPGSNLIAQRKVHFETWCIDEFVKALAKEKSLLRWVPPRRQPHIHIENNTLYLPLRKPAELSAQQAAILAACDGSRTAKQIYLGLRQSGSFVLNSENEVIAILEMMRDMGLIQWEFEAALESDPEIRVRKILQGVEDENLRQASLNALDELEMARQAVARSAGNSEALSDTMQKLENTFARLTGGTPTRSAGETYAARTLVYEDCRRDITIEVGPEIIRSMGPPLSLLLTSARWFTFELAAAYRKTLRQLYKDLVRGTGSSVIDFTIFWQSAQPIFFSEESPHLDALLLKLQERWTNILAPSSRQRSLAYKSEELRHRVAAMFDAPGPGWSYARYQSPDIMIASPSVDAINRGDYQFILGELHVGENTAGFSVFFEQHPGPEQLLAALEKDIPEPRLAPVVPKAFWPGQAARLLPALFSPRDFRLQLSAEPCAISDRQLLPMGSLVIEESGGELVIRTRDGRVRFEIIEGFADVITSRVSNGFKILPPAAHTPRIAIDRLVICRESWSFSASELLFAYEKEEQARFVSARRWASAHNIPRFAFVKVPGEVKPFYVDFSAPSLINILSKNIRLTLDSSPATQRITITEMLPQPDQTWLPDAKGELFTSELRIVAVDQAV